MTVSHDDQQEDKTMEEVAELFHQMADEGGLEHTYRMFNTKTFRTNPNIPNPIWKELEPAIKDKIMKIKEKLKKQHPARTPTPVNSEIPPQYPNMKSKTTIANLVNSIAGMELSDGEETDDDILQCSAYMVKQRMPIEPWRHYDGENEIRQHLTLDPPSDVIEVRAQFQRYSICHIRWRS